MRTEKAKLIKYLDHQSWDELFDLENDPYEAKNLHGVNSHLQKEMEQLYRQQADAVKFRIPPYADERP